METTLELLPDEVLILIFYELKPAELVNLCNTSINFNRFCNDKTLRIQTLSNVYYTKTDNEVIIKMNAELKRKESDSSFVRSLGTELIQDRISLEVVEALCIARPDIFLSPDKKIYSYLVGSMFNPRLNTAETAVHLDNYPIVKLLLQLGNYDPTLLLKYCRDDTVLKLLLEYGADPNVNVDIKEQETGRRLSCPCLHFYIENNKPNLVRTLLSGTFDLEGKLLPGADPNLPCNKVLPLNAAINAYLHLNHSSNIYYSMNIEEQISQALFIINMLVIYKAKLGPIDHLTVTEHYLPIDRDLIKILNETMLDSFLEYYTDPDTPISDVNRDMVVTMLLSRDEYEEGEYEEGEYEEGEYEEGEYEEGEYEEF